MKKSNLFLIPTILFVCSIIISSCGGKSSAEATAGSNAKAKEFANSMCKIADEIGLDENFKLTEDYLNKKEDKFEENALNKSDDIIRLLKQVDKHMGSLNNDQKTAFTKELMKAIIDTKCSDIFFKGIPYHDLGKLIETIENDAQNGTLYQASYNGSFYEFGHESLPKISVTGAPEDTDWDRWSILHDGEVYRLYFMPIGKSNKLYQFGFNPTTERYEYGYESMPVIPIANLPIDANVSNFSILFDGSYYRLYFKSSDNYSIYQCAFNTASSRYEYGYQSIKEISITNAPTDIDIKSWTMLHDGENYRLYFKSAKSKNLLHQFGFNGISYEYGYQSIEVLGVEGMPSIPFTRKFNITFDGISYRYYNLRKPN